RGRALYRVDLGAERAGLADDVGADVDDVGVVAGAADEGVLPGTAVEGVVARAAAERVGRGVAGDRVGHGIAGAVDRAGAGQRQALSVVAERPGGRALYRVDLGGGHAGLADDVGSDVHDVGVVARAAAQGIDTCAAVECVVAGLAQQRVGSFAPL